MTQDPQRLTAVIESRETLDKYARSEDLWNVQSREIQASALELVLQKLIPFKSEKCFETVRQVQGQLSQLTVDDADMAECENVQFAEQYLEGCECAPKQLLKQLKDAPNTDAKRQILKQVSCDYCDVKAFVDQLSKETIENLAEDGIPSDVKAQDLPRPQIQFPSQSQQSLIQYSWNLLNNKVQALKPLPLHTASLKKTEQLVKSITARVARQRREMLGITVPRQQQPGWQNYDHADALFCLQFFVAASVSPRLMSTKNTRQPMFLDAFRVVEAQTTNGIVPDRTRCMHGFQHLVTLLKVLGILVDADADLAGGAKSAAQQGGLAYKLKRADRIAETEARGLHAYTLPEATELKELDLGGIYIDDYTRQASDAEALILKAMKRTALRVTSDSVTLSKGFTCYFNVPYELLGLLFSFADRMKRQSQLKQDVQTSLGEFSRKLFASIQRVVFVTFWQLGWFDAEPFKYVSEAIRRVFKGDVTGARLWAALSDAESSGTYYQNLLDPLLFTHALFDQKVADLVVLRVLQAILAAFYALDLEKPASQNPQDPNTLLFTHLVGQIKCLYARLCGTSTEDAKVALPAGMLCWQEDDGAVHPDQFAAALFEAKMEDFVQRFAKVFTRENTRLLQPAYYQYDVDAFIGQHADFAVYRIEDSTVVALMFCEHMCLTLMNTSPSLMYAGDIATSSPQKATSLGVLRGNCSPADELVQCLDTQLKHPRYQEFRKSTVESDLGLLIGNLQPAASLAFQDLYGQLSWSISDVLNEQYQLPSTLKMDFVQQFEARLEAVRQLVTGMKGRYTVSKSDWRDLKHTSAEQQEELVRHQFAGLQRAEALFNEKFRMAPAIVDVSSVPLAQQTTRALLKWDLLSLFFEFLMVNLALNNAVQEELHALCECLHSQLFIVDITDELLGPVMHEFSQKLLELQKTAKPSNQSRAQIEEASKTYGVIFAAFEQNWAALDVQLFVLNLAGALQRNPELKAPMQGMADKIDNVFAEMRFTQKNAARIQGEVTEMQFDMMRCLKLMARQVDLMDLSLLDGVEIRDNVPASLNERYAELKTMQGRLLQTLRSSALQVSSLQSTVAQAFYQKKRLFQFQIPQQAEFHSFRQPQQNKQLRSALEATKSLTVDLMYKYDFMRLFKKVNEKFDGSQRAKQRVLVCVLAVSLVVDSVAAKSPFQKIQAQLLSGKTAELEAESLDPELIKEALACLDLSQLNKFVSNYILAHPDNICHSLQGQEDCVKQFGYEMKKITQAMQRSQKAFGELLSWNSTAQQPLGIEASINVMDALSNLLQAKLKPTCSMQFVQILEEDIATISSELLLSQQEKLGGALQKYVGVAQAAKPAEQQVEKTEEKPIEKPTETPVEPKEETPAKPKEEIPAESLEEKSAAAVLEQQSLSKKERKAQKKIQQQAQQARKEEFAAKQRMEEQQAQKQREEELQKQQQVEADDTGRQTASSEGAAPAKPIQEQTQDEMIPPADNVMDAPPGLEDIRPDEAEESESRYAKDLLRQPLNLKPKSFKISPDAESFGLWVEKLNNTLLSVAREVKTEEETAQFKALFPMNPHEFCAALLGKALDVLFMIAENPTAKFASACYGIAREFPELYLLWLGKHVASYQTQQFFRIVFVRLDSSYFLRKLGMARAALQDQAGDTIDMMLSGVDTNAIDVPYVVGFAASDYSLCQTYQATGCNLIGMCGHAQSAWTAVEHLYEDMQAWQEAPYLEFRTKFFQLLAAHSVLCPECGALTFLTVHSRALPLPAQNGDKEDQMSAIKEKMKNANYNDPERQIVVEIGGEGFLAGIKTTCWLNQFIDEWIQ